MDEKKIGLKFSDFIPIIGFIFFMERNRRIIKEITGMPLIDLGYFPRRALLEKMKQGVKNKEKLKVYDSLWLEWMNWRKLLGIYNFIVIIAVVILIASLFN
ncbi:MAG: hypothetical protein KC506_03445 [Nanoarchaeota archaeon]|nr:hypothetical protein [Nanoarchaeota archaeon]